LSGPGFGLDSFGHCATCQVAKISSSKTNPSQKIVAE